MLGVTKGCVMCSFGGGQVIDDHGPGTGTRGRSCYATGKGMTCAVNGGLCMGRRTIAGRPRNVIYNRSMRHGRFNVGGNAF